MTEMQLSAGDGAEVLRPAPVRIRRPPASTVRGRLLRTAVIAGLAVVLFFTLRGTPWAAVWAALARLQPWQLAGLLAMDAIIYVLITARWWFVVRADRPSARLLPLIWVRVSVFALSYFTFGPQVGGEALQVIYLRKHQQLSYTRATASVLTDKLLELLGNFAVVAIGSLALLQSGVLGGTSMLSRLGTMFLLLLVAWPVLHIVLLRRHVYPIAELLRMLHLDRRHRGVRFLRAAENLAGRFCQRQPRGLLAGVAVSLLASAAAVSEYALVASFLGIGLPVWQLVAASTAGSLSFLVPIPGGLGALEASQLYVLGSFGIPAAYALGLTLVLRGRDLVVGGVGLLLAGKVAWGSPVTKTGFEEPSPGVEI